MKVILLQEVEKLGGKNDVKEVADGFARNFLFPKKLAKPATEAALRQLEQEKEAAAKKEEENLVATEEIIAQLDGQEIEISAKADESSKLYGSITSVKIVKVLAEKGFDIKKNQIKLAEPIRELGEYDVALELEHGLEAKIKVIVTEQLSELEKPADNLT